MAAKDTAQCIIYSENRELIEEISKCNLTVCAVEKQDELVARAWYLSTEMIVVDGTGCTRKALVEQVMKLRQANRKAFICIYGDDVGRNPSIRIAVADCGASMVAWYGSAVKEAGNQVHASLQCSKEALLYSCPYCLKSGLSEDGLCLHGQLYHVNDAQIRTTCPICHIVPGGKGIQPHLRKRHGPGGRQEIPIDNHEDVAVYAFGLVVCQRSDGKFLLVQERYSVGFWLPGGRVNPREGLCTAARREALEEAGINVTLTGVLKLEFLPGWSSQGNYVRVRCIFMAKPTDPEEEVKCVPDYESMGAAWVSLQEMRDGLRLRGQEPVVWAEYLNQGKPVHPLSVLESI